MIAQRTKSANRSAEAVEATESVYRQPNQKRLEDVQFGGLSVHLFHGDDSGVRRVHQCQRRQSANAAGADVPLREARVQGDAVAPRAVGRDTQGELQALLCVRDRVGHPRVLPHVLRVLPGRDGARVDHRLPGFLLRRRPPR